MIVSDKMVESWSTWRLRGDTRAQIGRVRTGIAPRASRWRRRG
jgi:hypothetical protein